MSKTVEVSEDFIYELIEVVQCGTGEPYTTELLTKLQNMVCEHDWEDKGIAAQCTKCGQTNATQEIIDLVRS